MDVAIAIEHLIPAAEYGGSTLENTEAQYNKLRWTDARPKPTWDQIVAAYADWEATVKPEKDRRQAIYDIFTSHLDDADRLHGLLLTMKKINQVDSTVYPNSLKQKVQAALAEIDALP